jgi:hypothetical protein
MGNILTPLPRLPVRGGGKRMSLVVPRLGRGTTTP